MRLFYGILGLLLSTSVALAGGLPELELQTVTGGFSTAVAIDHAGDARLFVTEQGGLIRIVDAGGTLLPVPFLDLTALMGGGFEGGLKDIAFHPDYPTTPYVFVHYSDVLDDTIIARYEVSVGDPNVGDPNSGVEVLRIEQFTSQHRGGQIAFGPDGHLYIALGDGGGQNDPSCRAQRPDVLHGKILRIDIDVSVDTPPYHGIPMTNPFGGPGEPDAAVWSIGFRNPWRFSFDRLTGDLFIADVGQNTREEVSRQPAGSPGGENYGWKVMEGTFCHDPDPIDTDCPIATASCFDASYTPPILEYGHGQGDCSIAGGYVYRGFALPAFNGRYFYGDFCTGNLWAASEAGGTWTPQLLDVALPNLISFGEDVAGEIYLTEGGTLYRLAVTGLLFVDGFESGDTSAWDVTTPALP